MVDTIFSSDGVQAGPAGFLREAVDAIHEAGGLFIADEVQAGMGRTGETLWGYMRHGVAPDLITMGKPLGNGHPVAGVAARPQVLEAFGRNSRYFNTFGGNPVSAAAGLAVLRTVQQEGLMRNAERVGAYRASACKDWPRVMISSATMARACSSAWNWCATAPREPATEQAARVVNGLRDRQVLISSAGEHATP